MLRWQASAQVVSWTLFVLAGGGFVDGQVVSATVYLLADRAARVAAMAPAWNVRRRLRKSPTRSQDDLVWQLDRARNEVERLGTLLPSSRFLKTWSVLRLLERLERAERGHDVGAAHAAAALMPGAYDLLQLLAQDSGVHVGLVRRHLDQKHEELRRHPSKRASSALLCELTALADGYSARLERELHRPFSVLPARTHLFGGRDRWSKANRGDVWPTTRWIHRFMRGDRTRLRRTLRLNRRTFAMADAAAYIARSAPLGHRPLEARGVDWSQKRVLGTYADVALTADALGRRLGDSRVAVERYEQLARDLHRSLAFIDDDVAGTLKERHAARGLEFRRTDVFEQSSGSTRQPSGGATAITDVFDRARAERARVERARVDRSERGIERSTGR